MNSVVGFKGVDMDGDFCSFRSPGSPVASHGDADWTARISATRAAIRLQSVDALFSSGVFIVLKLVFRTKNELQIVVSPDPDLVRQGSAGRHTAFRKLFPIVRKKWGARTINEISRVTSVHLFATLVNTGCEQKFFLS